MELFDLFHPLDDRDAKGASLFTAPAGNAVLRLCRERPIVRPNGVRSPVLHGRKVIQLVHHCDINALGAGRAMAAVGALAAIGVVGRFGQHAGVVPLSSVAVS